MNVLILSGSLNKPSHTLAVLEEIALLLRNHGCNVTLYNLREVSLPPCDPKYHHNPYDHPHPEVKKLVQLAHKADAFVWGSPNYHNSYSGALKNALDHLNFDQFRNKPVGLVTNGGGIRSVQPLDHLRIVARGLLAVAIPIQGATCDNDFVLVEDRYVLKEEIIKNRLKAFVEQLIFFTKRLR